MTWGQASGVLVGFLGWWIGFVVVSLASGSFEAFRAVAVPGFLLSLGLGLVSVLCVTAVRRAWPNDQLLAGLTLWGNLLVSMGTLLLYLRISVLPEVGKNDSFMEVMTGLGSATSVPAWVVALCLVGGCAVTFLAARRALSR